MYQNPRRFNGSFRLPNPRSRTTPPIRAIAPVALYCAAALSVLAPQAAVAGPELQCPGTRYIYTSNVSVPDPVNAATTCVTSYDGGTVANNGTFNTSTPFSLGSSIWTAITDAFGRLLQIVNDTGITWNLGPLSGKTDSIGSAGNPTRYHYDAMNRVESTVAPVSPTTVTTTYTYDTTYTNQVNLTDRNGNTTTYTYDTGTNPGRPGSVTESPGGNTVTYTYEAMGRPDTVVETPGRTLTYTYDDTLPDRSVTRTETTPSLTTVYRYDYNSTGNIVEVRQDGSPITSYTYDAADNLIQITDMVPGPGRITTYQYDAQGRVTEGKDDMGTAAAGDDRYTCYQYDSAGHLTTYTEDTQSTCNSGLGTTTMFAYDAQGRLSGITDPQGAQAQLAFIPAPGSLLLLAFGLGALALRRRA